MRKILASLFFLLTFLTYLTNPQISFADCKIELTYPPGATIKKDFQGTIALKTKSNNECFGKNVPYKVVMYPNTLDYKDLSKTFKSTANGQILYEPVISENVSSLDGKTISGIKVNFNDEKVFSNHIYKPHEIGSWKILVCPAKNYRQCDRNYIADGSFQLGLADPAPTPSPAPDQPSINPFEQIQCVFQYTNDPDFIIPITAKVQEPKDKYKWWWNESGWFWNDPDIQETGIKPDSSGNLKIQIKGSVLRELIDPTKKEGNDFCVDVAGSGKQGKEIEDDPGGQMRTGPNCIKIFFTNGNPIEQNIDTSCSRANRIGEPKTSPVPPPQCAYWTYNNGIPVPTHEPNKKEGFKGTQNEYIQHNIIDLKSLKCERVHTAIGSINTEPTAFVRSLFSIVLGLAGGIALFLIIYSGAKMMASQGNAEQVTAAREQFIAAIIGLLFIIFSFVILQIIGVDILRIPGFTK